MHGRQNFCREPFTSEEAVAVGEEIRVELKLEEEARERQRAGGLAQGGDRRSEEAKADRAGKSFPKPIRDESARSSSIAAEAAGMSRPTYEKAKKVIEAAKAEPEKYRPH